MQYFLLDVEFKVTFNPPKFCQLLTLHRAASIGMEPVSGGFELPSDVIRVTTNNTRINQLN